MDRRCPRGPRWWSHLAISVAVILMPVAPLNAQPSGAAGPAPPARARITDGLLGEPAADALAPRAPGGPAPLAADLRSLLAVDRSQMGGRRLSRAPNMFGDSFNVGGNLTATQVLFDPVFPMPISVIEGSTDIPLAGSSRRVKVAENNKALPQDRIYVLYNHFHNAFEFAPDSPGPRDFSVDRYSFGVEKTFRDGRWSVELRMPFTGDMNASTRSLSVDGGHVGNLALLLKRLLYQDDRMAVAAGLGIDTPTGDDVTGSAFTPYVVRNEATHLLPYVGFLGTPSDQYFYQGFLQVDVPLNGNSVEFPALGTSLGTVNEQTLLYLDLEVGRWLYRNPCARWLTGLAGVVEFHYTTALQEADRATLVVPVSFTPFAGTRTWIFGNSANRMDIVNLTVGLHGEITNDTLVRVGGVFPLRRGDDRSFDAEVQVQVERRF